MIVFVKLNSRATIPYSTHKYSAHKAENKFMQMLHNIILMVEIVEPERNIHMTQLIIRFVLKNL